MGAFRWQMRGHEGAEEKEEKEGKREREEGKRERGGEEGKKVGDE